MTRARKAPSIILPFLVACLVGPGAAPRAHAQAIEHIVLFHFKDDASPSQIREILDAFEGLPTKIAGITGFQWGVNNSPEGLAKGFTHGFVVTFKDAASRDAYFPHVAHQALVSILMPALAEVFAFDFAVNEPPPAAEPGRTHHLVFFKFKDSTTPAQVDEVNGAFAQLPRKVSGLVHYRAGTNNLAEPLNKGFTHGYHLTFANDRARDDYLIHPDHRRFGSLVGSLLAEALVLDFTVGPSSRSLFVMDGLEPYRVYQRDADGGADLQFKGISRNDGVIEARLRSGRRTVPGFDWRPAGKAVGGLFEAKLDDVPAGGEYTVEVRRRDALGNVGDHTEVANILVGDIWILAGQSNMEGVGDLVAVEAPDPLVHCFTMGHRWELATEPLHWLIDSPDPVHSGGLLKDADEDGRRERRAGWRAARTKGAGLGLPFARELARRTGIPVGLVAAAHGGTSMEQWDPAKKGEGGDSLYGSMLKQVKNAGGKVKGVLWYQGESDASPGAAPLFADRFKGLVAAFREDLGAPTLPFYYVQIGRFIREGGSEHWNQIQELQRRLEGEIPGTAVVPVIDLELDDLIHVGTQGLKRVGRRLAKIAHRELFAGKCLERGPRLSRITLADGRKTIRVEYSEVNGRLFPAGKVEGFSLHRPDGSEVKLIYKAIVDGESPNVVVLHLQQPAPEDALLSYGAGMDPVANLVDGEDMAAPVFGLHPLP